MKFRALYVFPLQVNRNTTSWSKIVLVVKCSKYFTLDLDSRELISVHVDCSTVIFSSPAAPSRISTASTVPNIFYNLKHRLWMNGWPGAHRQVSHKMKTVGVDPTLTRCYEMNITAQTCFKTFSCTARTTAQISEQ